MPYANKLLGILSILILAGCTVSKTICPCEAPEIIRLGEKEVEINAQISLIDTMSSGAMKVKIWLTTTDHTTLPANFKADYYYLRSSNLDRDAFEGKFTTINTDFNKGIMELEAINAPRWGKGEFVDVAVHLTDSRGKVHFVKKDAVPVQPANR
ncbi:MAG: hypothetical protein GZ094_12250 [Mariniphaga sp.]|nr:hypothetical protein [Mariniphaga sp.]